MNAHLDVLLVEDSPLDALVLAEQLSNVGTVPVRVDNVTSVASARLELARRHYDCVLLDLSLPDAEYLEALDEIHRASPDTPVVVLSGSAGEDLAVRAVQEGAQDYLVKGEAPPELLMRALRYAIERKQAERQLAALALTDVLTGLPNRVRLLDRAGHALDRMSRLETVVAVLFLDIDRFKLVNDSLGHAAGDRLLVAVAERLVGALRPSDTVARFGGDEFVVLCEDLQDPDEAEIIAERVLAALSEPVLLDGQEVFVSASVGVALASGSDDSAERLLREADAAMYRAKEQGRAHARFDEGMRVGARRRLRLESELNQALRRCELVLHYQPLVGLGSDSRTVGVEALVRWQHPVDGLLPPHDFIEIAEETGLVRPLGAWVLRQACRQLATWDREAQGAEGLTMAVNLSAHQLADDDLVEQVAETLRAEGVEAPRLCLEITESVLVEDSPAVLDRIYGLKALGVRIAVDDFGTGFSSLSILSRLPLDVLKIDRGFVAQMATDERDHRIVTMVLGLARSLDLRSVAEGVEDAVQARELRALGCETAQGFLYGPPMPASEVARRLSDPGEMADAVRVYLCDDVPEMRARLRTFLGQDPGFKVVGEAADSAGIIDAVKANDADVILFGLMPSVGGLEAIVGLRQACPTLGVVVLSGHERRMLGDPRAHPRGERSDALREEVLAGVAASLRSAASAQRSRRVPALGAGYAYNP